MRVVPRRSPWLQLSTVLAAFLLGPLGGLRLAMALAPEADVVQTLSVFAMAAVFMGGTLLWMGLGIAVVVGKALWSLIRRRRPGPAGLTATDEPVPPGYRAYPVLGLVIGGTMGLIAGVLTPLAVTTAIVAWLGLGVAYGAALWAAAHHGWLPFPEPE
jgi:hypothetical protein